MYVSVRAGTYIAICDGNMNNNRSNKTLTTVLSYNVYIVGNSDTNGELFWLKQARDFTSTRFL